MKRDFKNPLSVTTVLGSKQTKSPGPDAKGLPTSSLLPTTSSIRARVLLVPGVGGRVVEDVGGGEEEDGAGIAAAVPV